ADPIGRPSPLVVMRVYDRSAADASIATEIAAMQHDGQGATPALLDVANLADGRVCLVVERLGGVSLAALIAPGDLLPGQAVTALAPVVVAARELADLGLVHVRLAAADVVVDDTGRPRLLGLGALAQLDGAGSAGERVELLRRGHAALLRLIEDVAAATRDARAFDSVIRTARAALDARPFVRIEAELERALFAVAAPLPLPGLPSVVHARGLPARLTPVRSVEAVPDHLPLPADPGAVLDVDVDRDDRRPARGRTRIADLAQLPGGLAGGLAASLDRSPRAAVLRRVAGWVQRRRPVLVSGGVIGAGALVALLTVVPPSGSDVPADAGVEASVGPAPGSPDVPAERAGAGPSSDAGIAGDAAARVADDPVDAAAALLEIRTSCLASADEECLAAVDQPGSPIEARDRALIEQGAADPMPTADLDAITVVADLGDAVVLAVPDVAAEREPASLLMMRSEAGWRLREWFD
ncbi:MAG TPA: hypothetical protein VFS72_16170, partial [Agromyces sp.]|nr:hypothetical protein [Agromyces sp.]